MEPSSDYSLGRYAAFLSEPLGPNPRTPLTAREKKSRQNKRRMRRKSRKNNR